MSADIGTIVIIKSPFVGDGEPDMGEALMASFLKVLAESGTPPSRIYCLASGVFLTTEGSTVADRLGQLAERGTEIYSCGTCLEYYGRKNKLIVGAPTTMKEMVAAQMTASRVIYA